MFASIFLLVPTLSLLQSVSCTDKAAESFANWTPNEDSWNYWWSYSGVSGPTYWGLLNLDWFMCDKGRRQSPINIETDLLVYDPHLTPLSADNNLINGVLYNDGHAIVFNGTIPSIVNPNNNKPQPIDSNHSNNTSSRSEQENLKNENQASILNLALGEESKFDSSSSLLRDLSNSIEVSINNNDRTETQPPDLADGLAEDNLNNEQIVAENEQKPAQAKVHFSGAGLMYSYRFEALYLRFGVDSSNAGSEHQINSHSYAAELQIMAFNSVLYKSYAEASSKPQGLLGIAIMVDLLHTTSVGTDSGPTTTRGSLNEPLESLLNKMEDIKHRGFSTEVRNFNLSALIQEKTAFVSYEGSLTTPGCDESVVWLVLNKPLYISQSTFNILRSISAEEQTNAPTGTLIAGNIRPIQPVNSRPIRTNIKPKSKNQTHVRDFGPGTSTSN